MFATRDHGLARRHLWPATVFAAGIYLSWVPHAEASDVTGAVSPKLTTVLADLVRSVSPAPGQAPAERADPTAGFSMESTPKSVRDAVHHRMLRINASSEVQVYILMGTVTDENLSQLRANGVTIEIPDAAHRRVQARIPVTRLQSVAELPFVNFIRLPSYAIRLTGSVDTEGDAILRADLTRAQSGLDGTGVRVGVISDGLKGVFATGCTTCGPAVDTPTTPSPIVRGDLPSATGTRNVSGVLTSSTGGITGRSFASNNDLEGLIPGCSFAGAGAEGTALLEIVHDLAPGAQLSFANADTDLAFANAVNFLAASNDIVTDDLGFLGLPYDGTSGISANTASALNNNSNAIRGYFTSVGNFADEHYYGTYTDSGVNGSTISGVTKAGDLHLFHQSSDTTDVMALGPKPYNVVLLPPGGEVVVFLTWDDDFGRSGNNYDLYLVRESTNTVVAGSADVQSGTQDPLELFDYVNNTGSQDYFHIIVQNVANAAQPRHLNIFSFQPECATDGPRRLAPSRHERLAYNTPTRSVPAESDSGGSPVSVVSVGAICSASQTVQDLFGGDPTRDESCFDTTNSTIEFFSSLGPTLPTLDGTDLGRTKPDISGIDGVSITGAGSFDNPFFGTSAAAPHLAGIAALVLQAAPCLLDGSSGALDDVTARTNLRTLILDNSVPLGGTVPNNTFGYGRADALAAVDQSLPAFTGTSTVAIGGNAPTGASISASELGFTDPNSCLLTTLNWTGGCGTGPASSLNCPFGTNTVSVSASNNGVTFSSAADVQIVVTNFAVGFSPTSQTVTAGQSASYMVTVSAQGGAYGRAVTLACSNVPAQANCSFNPASVTPGATSAQSTLTISTVARATGPLGRPFRGAPPLLVLLAGATLIFITLMTGRPMSRRKLAAVGAAALLLALVAVQVACSNRPSGTPAGTYDVAITGTAGTLVNSGTATLDVQ